MGRSQERGSPWGQRSKVKTQFRDVDTYSQPVKAVCSSAVAQQLGTSSSGRVTHLVTQEPENDCEWGRMVGRAMTGAE